MPYNKNIVTELYSIILLIFLLGTHILLKIHYNGVYKY